MNLDMRMLSTLAAAAAAVIAATVAGAASGSSVAHTCNLWAAPSGNDANRGTKAGPFLTLGKLAATLAPGQTGCLAPGTSFATREVITAVGSPGKRVTITTAPGGARAILGDGIETTQATRFLTLTNLAIQARDDSPTRDVWGTVILRGYSTQLTRSDVGPGTLKEVGRSCIVLDHANSAVIAGNVLHDCNGGSANHYSAGVLASTSAGARILDNVIYGNVGGVYFGGDAKTASRDNTVEQNVITLNGRFDVHSAYGPGSPVGRANVVRKNCISSPGAKTAAGIGFTMGRNRMVNPRVLKGQRSYSLTAASPCRAYRPRA
jgi:Right handed beta helix region